MARLFLDEINHLEPASQARLLNLLPDGDGNPVPGCLSVRVISSTTRNLEDEMRNGRFREELYYRINGVHLRLPPLRNRKEDIPALLDFFLKKYASLFGRPEPHLSAPTMDLLLRHAWPGNIRELENFARKIVALGNEQLATHDLASGDAPKTPSPPLLPRSFRETGMLPPVAERSRPGSLAACRTCNDSEPTGAHALEPQENRARAANQLQGAALQIEAIGS